MMDTAADDELATRHIRKLIRGCLEQCSAMRHDRLIECVGLAEGLVVSALDEMVQLGEIEVIRPLGARTGEPSVGPIERRTHYRLLQDTDDGFAWEQFQFVALPVGRLADVRTSENRSRQPVPRMAEEVWG